MLYLLYEYERFNLFTRRSRKILRLQKIFNRQNANNYPILQPADVLTEEEAEVDTNETQMSRYNCNHRHLHAPARFPNRSKSLFTSFELFILNK